MEMLASLLVGKPLNIDEPVKSQKPDGFEKSSISRRVNLEE